MNSITVGTAPRVSADRERARRALGPVAVGVLLVSAFFNLARADTLPEGAAMLVVDVLALALVFGLVVVRGLRAEAAGGRGVLLGAVGVLLLVPAFWSGLPVVLGAAAVLLGYAGRRAATGSGRAVVALVLGMLSVIGYVAVYLGDWVAHPGASWWS